MGVSTYGKFNDLLKHVKGGSHYPIPQAVKGFQAAFDGLNGIQFTHDGAEKAAKIQYSLDGGEWLDAPENGHLPSVANGVRSLRLRGVNGIGQPGPVTTAITVSINPPPLAVTDFAISKLGAGIMGYSFTPAIGSARTEYSLDGGPWTTTTLPLTHSGLATGVHTLRLRGVNAVGVAGPETAPLMLRVYALPDFVTSMTATPMTVDTAKLVIVLPANATTAEYSLDSGPWMPAALTTTISGLTSGLHGVRVRGINQDGDRGPISGPVTFTLAAAPGQITDLRISDQTITTFALLYTSPSNTVSFQVSFDGGAWTAWTPGRFNGISLGNHTVQLRGVNTDGFPGPASNLVAFNMPVPVSPVTNFGVSNKASRSFVVTYTKPAEATGVQYRVNSGAWTNMPANSTVNVVDPGNYTIQLRSVLSGGTYGTPTDYYVVTLVATWQYDSFSQYWATAAEFAKQGGQFGYGVAMSGDGTSAAASAAGEGAIYVFNTTTPSSLSRTARILAPETVTGFGRMLSMSADGKTIAAGSAANKVYIFTLLGSTWTYLQTLTGSDFGLYSMSLSDDGKVLYVTSSGGSATFTKNGSTYVRSGTLPMSTNTGSPQALNADGTFAVTIGDGGNNFDVWSYANATWSRSAMFFAGIALRNVTISSNGLYVAGTTLDMVNTRVFSRPNTASTSWNQQAALQRYAPLTSGGNGSSISISADGSVLLVSSDYSQFNTSNGIYGYAAIYTRSGSTWSFANEGNVDGRYGLHSQIARQGGKFVIGADTATISGFNNAGRMAVCVASMV